MKQDKLEGIIFDVDGVLEFQGTVYPGAIGLLDALRKKGIYIRVVTNSTLKSRKQCTEKLQRRGFDFHESEVITASFATAQFLKSLHPQSCWVLLKGEGLKEFKDFTHDSDNPEYLILGDLREDFNFHTINKALQCLLNGSKFIVMISDTVDNSMGSLELTVGAYGKMLEEAAQIQATYIGKPSSYIFDMALNTLNIDRTSVVMVGDKISTDILGAQNAGIKSALIKTGEFKDSDLDCDIKPDYIFDSVKELIQLF